MHPLRRFLVGTLLVASVFNGGRAHAAAGLGKVNHIIIVMQENHSFDNYFGVLPYVPGTPYHSGPCKQRDHQCVDALTCTASQGTLACSNSNPASDGSQVMSFHDPFYCTEHDPSHTWFGAHSEANFDDPANALTAALNDGFVKINGGPPNETMGYYDDSDLPLYYSLAKTFAIDDRYFSSVMGPTIANRFFLMAATSFGHIEPGETIAGFGPRTGTLPTPVPYNPVTGSIFSLLDQFKVSWTDYYSDVPESVSFLTVNQLQISAVKIDKFYSDAASGRLPQVAFVESADGDNPFDPQPETDEHPPTDIRAGQFFVSQVVNAIRNGPNWKDSIIFITYDEGGGFYDHVLSPRASQGRKSNPDGINPGQCEDLSNPPASEQPGGGSNCIASEKEAERLCPDLANDPTGPYPQDCPNFDQYGFRVPFMAVSPFSKPHYVSHMLADHTSILALIEKRFIGSRQKLGHHLTERDRRADTLEEMFDFKHAPSLNASIPTAPPPVSGEHGCSAQ